jgi:hypothetical protein
MRREAKFKLMMMEVKQAGKVLRGFLGDGKWLKSLSKAFGDRDEV